MDGNLTKQPIDERVIRILNLEDVFDLDYETYYALLKEVLVEITSGKRSIPSEEVEVLKESLKEARNKRKDGRFEPVKKPKKINAGNISNLKMLPGSGGALVKYDKNLNAERPKVNYFDLIIKSLDNIVEILSENFKFDQKERENNRKRAESEKREKRENALEKVKKTLGTIVNTAKKFLSPLQEIFDRIIRFITFVILGRAFVALMKWLGDPNNKSKIETLGKLLKTFWPAILAALVLFTNPFGKFVRVIIGMIAKFSIRMLKLIPKLLRVTKSAGPAALSFATKHPLLTGAVLSAGGAYFASQQNTQRREDFKKTDPNIVTPGSGKTPGGSQLMQESILQRGIGAFKLGGPIKPIKLAYGYNGIDSNTGEKVSGAGPDTQLILARPREVVLTPEDQDDIYQRTGLDIAHYVSGRKPKFVKSSNIKFGGQGYAGGGIIQRFDQGGIVGNQSPKINESDYNTLLAISALEDTNPQGRADVAQSLYNRMFAVQKYGVNFNQKSGSLKDIINAGGQFEPTFSNKSDWLNIKDRNSAAIAIMNSAKGKQYKWDIKEANNQLNATEKALKNPEYQALAQKHVGGRTFFLGTSQQKNMKPGDVLRGPEQNFFSPWLTEGTPYDKERRNIAAPIPKMLLPKENPKNKPDKKTSQSLFGGIIRRIQQGVQSLFNFGSFNRKKSGGEITENTGMDIVGATRDRQLLPPILAEPGESHYIFSKVATQNGAVEAAKLIESHLNPNSTAAQLGYKSKKIPLITPLPQGMSSSKGMVSTLPPITKSVGGSQGLPTEDNTGVFFSPVSPASIETRKLYYDLLGISAG